MAISRERPPSPSADSAPIVVYLGPARSGKTRELVGQYRDALVRASAGPVDRALWLAPNAPAAALVRGQLLADGLEACLRPGVVTFDQLTGLILADALRSPTAAARRLDPLMGREVLRRVVEAALEKKGLKFFADAARRTGFIDLLAEHIRELKRRDIAAEAYAKIGPSRGDQQQHRELAQLYADYEQQLKSHGLADAESDHRAARDALAAGACRRFESLELIVVDGFTDFTRIQLDILRLLARHTKQLLISLPDDPSDCAPRRTGRLSGQSLSDPASATDSTARHDLFAKVAATLAELRHHFPQLEVRGLATRRSRWPAIDHLTQHIFRHPAHLPATPPEVLESLDRLEIVAAAGAQDEIVQIARRIKRRLTAQQGGSKPGDIVVVFRSLAEVAPRIREVFAQFGIPYYLDARLPVLSAPVVKALLALVRLDDENWPFRRVVSVLTNNTLSALDGPARQAADWLVRDLQTAMGRDALLERVEELAAEHSQPGERAEHVQRRTEAAAAALSAFRRLASALAELPTEASPTEWRDALARLGTQLGLAPFASDFDPDDSSVEMNDLAAWQGIAKRFASLQRLNAWLGEPQRKLTRREMIGFLLDVAAHESLPRPHDDVGSVRVLAAPNARTVSAKHLYLAGMSEQTFPSPESAGRLGTEGDYRFFSRAANQQRLAQSQHDPPAASRAQDEMLLFYEVLSRAEQSLTISYPALDDKAQDLPPSPYVIEIQRTLGGEQQTRVRTVKPQLSPVPQDATPFSLSNWRVQAIAQAIDGKRHLLAGLFACEQTKPLGETIDAGLRIIHARARGESFGPAEGLLTSPAVANRLAQRFGPLHLWSPSQWETYAACPYKFFLEVVLGLEPLGDLVLETDFARRGSRLHRVLAAFHRQWPKVRGGHPMGADEEAALFLGHLQSVIDERLAASPRGGIDAALLELDRRQITKWAEKHFNHHLKYAGACSKLGGLMTPTHLEFRFGPARPGDADNDRNSTANALVLEIGGEQIRVGGQIDRIDVGTLDGKTVFNVIDYKSGKKLTLKQEHIESGERLQLPIYVEAAQALVFGGAATPLAAAYWSMDGGFDAKGALAVQQEDAGGDRWQKVQAGVHERIRQFVAGIRRGEYPVASLDDQCTSYCNFHTVCRISQVRSIGKTWPSAAACGLAPDDAQATGVPLGRG